jgi:tRNA threonylcarbamoyl adenosine modification protein YeaZ
MTAFLTLQSTYTGIEIGIFVDGKQVAYATETKFNATKNFTILMERLLGDAQTSLSELDFIAVNSGPAPFTTLRTVMASVNGLAFATHIPLIGVSGLEAFLQEHTNDKWSCTLYLLNAFAGAVYYGIEVDGTLEKIGCMALDDMLTFLATRFPIGTIRFLGNGTILYALRIKEFFGDRAFIPAIIPEGPTLSFVAAHAYHQWRSGYQGVSQLLPLYLK